MIKKILEFNKNRYEDLPNYIKVIAMKTSPLEHKEIIDELKKYGFIFACMGSDVILAYLFDINGYNLNDLVEIAKRMEDNGWMLNEV